MRTILVSDAWPNTFQVYFSIGPNLAARIQSTNDIAPCASARDFSIKETCGMDKAGGWRHTGPWQANGPSQ